MDPRHPVHIGNIPNLIYKHLIDLHYSALFPSTPCTWATSNLIYKTLMEKHLGTPTSEDFNSCDLGGSK